MIVAVKLFARAKDLAGTESVQVELHNGATVAQLRSALSAKVPALSGLLQRSAIAVNDQFVEDNSVVPPNAEVALIPPVSGG